MDNLDFNNKVLGVVDLFGQEFWITQTLVSTLIIGFVMILFAIYVNISIAKFNKLPTGFQNVIELIVEGMDKFVKDTMGNQYASFGSWFFGMFMFLIMANLSGLVGLRPPTADLAMTAALALTTFFCIHFYGITKSKGEYFKGYIYPNPAFLPINLIGEVATPISLSFRLFGNILGGLIIMGMMYEALPFILRFVVPIPFHAYFDLFAGSLQAFIFVILSMTFISQKLPE